MNNLHQLIYLNPVDMKSWSKVNDDNDRIKSMVWERAAILLDIQLQVSRQIRNTLK